MCKCVICKFTFNKTLKTLFLILFRCFTKKNCQVVWNSEHFPIFLLTESETVYVLGFFLLLRSIMVIFSHLRCGARTLSSCGTRVYLQRAQQQQQQQQKQLRRIGRGEWKTHSIKPRRRRHWFFYIYNTDNPPWVQVFCSHPSSSPEQLSRFVVFIFRARDFSVKFSSVKSSVRIIKSEKRNECVLWEKWINCEFFNTNK